MGGRTSALNRTAAAPVEVALRAPSVKILYSAVSTWWNLNLQLGSNLAKFRSSWEPSWRSRRIQLEVGCQVELQIMDRSTICIPTWVPNLAKLGYRETPYSCFHPHAYCFFTSHQAYIPSCLFRYSFAIDIIHLPLCRLLSSHRAHTPSHRFRYPCSITFFYALAYRFFVPVELIYLPAVYVIHILIIYIYRVFHKIHPAFRYRRFPSQPKHPGPIPLVILYSACNNPYLSRYAFLVLAT